MKKKTQDGEGGLAPLVKGELAAVETYKQALEKVGDAPAGKDLRRIESEHEEAATLLQEKLEELELEAPEDSGLWGDWAKAVEGAGKLLGNKAAIKALKEGEEHGARGYENALRDESLDAEIRGVIRTSLLPKTKAHIPVLDRMLEEATSGKQ